MSTLLVEELSQREIPGWQRALIYIGEIVLIYLISTVPHEFIGHALPLALFGYGIAEVGFVPPAGAYVRPDVPLEAIFNPGLFIILFGGLTIDILLAFGFRQGEFHFDLKKNPQNRIIFNDINYTPLVQNFFRLYSITLAGQVLYNAFPTMQVLIQNGGWGLGLVPTTDGSTYLYLTLFQKDIIGFGAGIVMIGVLCVLSLWIVLGLVKYFRDWIREIRGEKEEKVEQFPLRIKIKMRRQPK